jgi:hypothetical protein
MRKSDAVAPLRNQKHIEARLRPFLRFILLQIAISYFMVLLRWWCQYVSSASFPGQNHVLKQSHACKSETQVVVAPTDSLYVEMAE